MITYHDIGPHKHEPAQHKSGQGHLYDIAYVLTDNVDVSETFKVCKHCGVLYTESYS